MEQKKKALGRGLEQLFNNEVLDFDAFESNIVESARESDIVEVNVDDIKVNPYQPRKSFNQEALDELATSIKNYGVFQPIIIKKTIKGYYLVAGERRLRASKLAGKKTIPAIIKEFTDDEMREIALLENVQRENLTAIELAWAYKGIIDSLHIRQEDLALRLGKSRSHITNTLGLLRLPTGVQNLVLENKISMGHARVLSKLENDDEIVSLAKKIVDDNVSVHDLEEMTNKTDFKKKVVINRKPMVSDYDYVERELKEIFGTKVKINNNKLQIFFENNADLDRILDIMNIKIN